MNRKGELAFRAVALISSVLLLVASLLLGVRTAARNDAAARMRREAETLRRELLRRSDAVADSVRESLVN